MPTLCNTAISTNTLKTFLTSFSSFSPTSKNNPTISKKAQIDQIVEHTHTLQQKIQQINGKLDKLVPQETPTANNQQVQQLQTTVAQHLASLVKQLQSISPQNSSPLTNAATQLEEHLQHWQSQFKTSAPTERPPSHSKTSSHPLNSSKNSDQKETSNAPLSRYHRINDRFEEILNFILNLLQHLKDKANKQQISQINQTIEHIHALQQRIQRINDKADSLATSSAGENTTHPENNLVHTIEKIPFVQHLKQTVEQHLAPLAEYLQSSLSSAENTLTNAIDQLKQHLQQWQSEFPISPLQKASSSHQDTSSFKQQPSTKPANQTNNLSPAQYSDINQYFEDILSFLLNLLPA